ncbi:MAG TPA: hypothetical protein DD438_11995 [Verrucomicrobiales bacterium]|nr:hypothetical protein [Roseibacillus sp.]HBM78824.1 hypothetical protein [Verrucomicrobiales bacterium]|tara:strand:- start:721 stop:2121 length:1401 start_codon:yes stop_codon:yes gene_type:complete
MKKSLLLILLFPAIVIGQQQPGDEGNGNAALPAELTPVRGFLTFANEDKVSGTPEGIDEDGNLRWNAPFLHQPIPVKPSSLLEMRLEGGLSPIDEGEHHALLLLTNGDTLRGQLNALDEEHVTLQTWYAGPLKIRRTMASDLEIQRANQTVYSGPEDFDSWVIEGEKDSWTLNGGSLSSNKGAGIAREIKTPDRCRIQFDLAWRSSLRFRVLLLSDKGSTTQPDNCYDLVCQRRFVYLRKRWVDRAAGGSKIVGQANIPELAEKESVRFEFYIDRKEGTIALYVDGRQAQVWTDENPKAGSFGNWLHFISEDFYKVKVSRIRVSPWKGELPDTAELEADPEEDELEGQRIRLQNGDTVVGNVGLIKDGVLAVETPFCKMNIPVDRMRTIDLTEGDYEEPIRKKGDVRGWLREGGRITFRLDAFSKETLTGYSQTFGNVEFKLNAFSRLEFNIYDEELEALRSGGNW